MTIDRTHARTFRHFRAGFGCSRAAPYRMKASKALGNAGARGPFWVDRLDAGQAQRPIVFHPPRAADHELCVRTVVAEAVAGRQAN